MVTEAAATALLLILLALHTQAARERQPAVNCATLLATPHAPETDWVKKQRELCKAK